MGAFTTSQARENSQEGGFLPQAVAQFIVAAAAAATADLVRWDLYSLDLAFPPPLIS